MYGADEGAVKQVVAPGRQAQCGDEPIYTLDAPARPVIGWPYAVRFVAEPVASRPGDFPATALMTAAAVAFFMTSLG